MNTTQAHCLAAALCCLCVMTLAHADELFAPYPGLASTVAIEAQSLNDPSDSRFRTLFRLQGGAAHSFQSDIDGGGKFNVNRFYIEPALLFHINERTSYGVSFGVSLDQFDFSSPSGLSATDPWSEIFSYRISGSIRFPIDDQWTFFGLPTIRWAGERDAEFSDALTGGAILGASYEFNERLSIGPGIGIYSQIEDSVNVFPVLLINWQLNDQLAIRTGGGLAATQGPGLVLAWQFHTGWELLIGARYENFRFRLDDNGPVPSGVGEEEYVPLYAALNWQIDEDTRVGFLAGVNLNGSLRLENSVGGFIAEQDHDPALFLGIAFSLQF